MTSLLSVYNQYKTVLLEHLSQLNEAGTVPQKDVKKLLEPYNWTFDRRKGSSLKITSPYGPSVNGHVGHSGATDELRPIDKDSLDRIRTILVDEYLKRESKGDPSRKEILEIINKIDWNTWEHVSPYKRELTYLDPRTGEPRETEDDVETIDKRIQGRINRANEKFKDAEVRKIYEDDEDSVYFLIWVNENHKLVYNTCRSKNDRRPLLPNDWTEPDYVLKDEKGNYWFGEMMEYGRKKKIIIKYKQILPNGKFKKGAYKIEESKKMLKSYKKLW